MLRPTFAWNLGRRTLALGERTLVMGVVNVTPDSFSDGGEFLESQKAIAHGLRLLDEGADILDVGGESTRPGATPLSAEEELGRVLPVLAGLRRERPGSVLSVDTYKAEVAHRAVEAGADIVNDVSGLRWDPAMAGTLGSLRCGAILMHTRGRPDEWRSLPKLDDPLAFVLTELRQIADTAIAAGIAHDRLVLDPGFGFGKRYDENYPLLAHFDRLHSLGFPLLSGPSRKSFLGRTAGSRFGVGDLPADQRLAATLAAVTASVLKGAHVVRVHDVRPAVEAVAIADAILHSSPEF
jgi:dihydropteroate synthase